MRDGEVFEHDGNRFRVYLRADDTHGAPWNEEDGHGPVSDWRSRGCNGHYAKSPGERLLFCTRTHAMFYDFAEAIRIAHRDGWGFMPLPLTTVSDASGHTVSAGPFKAHHPTDINAATREVYAQHRATFPTIRAYRAAAEEADFKRMQDWCDEVWIYIGVIVELVNADDEPMGYSESLWGIESDADEYIADTAM